MKYKAAIIYILCLTDSPLPLPEVVFNYSFLFFIENQLNLYFIEM